jgi:hypothetical protein
MSFGVIFETLSNAQRYSYTVEQELRWALSILAAQRRDESPPTEIDVRIVRAMRAMDGMQIGIARAISQLKCHQLGIGD